MAKVRDDISDLRTYRNTASFEDRYPVINRVMDGRVHELVAGQDFKVKTESFRNSLKDYAKRRSLPLMVRTERKSILVQLVSERTPDARVPGNRASAKRKPAKRKPARKKR